MAQTAGTGPRRLAEFVTPVSELALVRVTVAVGIVQERLVAGVTAEVEGFSVVFFLGSRVLRVDLHATYRVFHRGCHRFTFFLEVRMARGGAVR